MAYTNQDNGGIQRVAIVAPPEGITALNQKVQGIDANDVPTTGNPISVAGQFQVGGQAGGGIGNTRILWVGSQGQLIIGTNTTAFNGNAKATTAVGGLIDANATQKALAVANWVSNGTTFDMLYTPNVWKAFSATVITTETTIWTPTSGKKFRLMGYVITQGVVTGNITVKDNTAGTTILVIPANTIGVPQISPRMGNGILSAAANNVLTFTGASTETVSGYVFGTED